MRGLCGRAKHADIAERRDVGRSMILVRVVCSSTKHADIPDRTGERGLWLMRGFCGRAKHADIPERRGEGGLRLGHRYCPRNSCINASLLVPAVPHFPCALAERSRGGGGGGGSDSAVDAVLTEGGAEVQRVCALVLLAQLELLVGGSHNGRDYLLGVDSRVCIFCNNRQAQCVHNPLLPKSPEHT